MQCVRRQIVLDFLGCLPVFNFQPPNCCRESHIAYPTCFTCLCFRKKWYWQLNFYLSLLGICLIFSVIYLGNISAELFLCQPSLRICLPSPAEQENLLELFCQVFLDTNLAAVPLVIRTKLKTLFTFEENNMLKCMLFRNICTRYRLNIWFSS